MKAHKHEVIMKDETRVALLEQSIGHINETMLRIEKRFDMVDNRFDKVDKRFDLIDSRLDRLEGKVDSNFKWLLGIYIGGLASLFGIMAHGFHWV